MTQTADPTTPFVPRCLTDRDYWESVKRDPATAALIEKMIASAEALPPVPQLPHASDFLAARRTNDRNRTDRAWQTERRYFNNLIVRRCVLGLDETDLDDRLLDWLWAFVNQPTWVVSAHLPNNDLPAAGWPQLDLAACEMAAILGETLELLGPWIHFVSGTLHQTIIDEIDRRVLKPFIDHPEHREWTSEKRDPDRNNWTGVCAGNILTACEALARIGHPRPAARDRALRLLRIFFDEAFTEHGECDEGTSYWNYGVGMACEGLMRLTPDEVRRRISPQRLAQVAAYPRQTHLFDDWFYAGNDAQMRARASVVFVPWLAAMTDDAFLRYWLNTAPAPVGGNLTSVLRAIEVMRKGHHLPPATADLVHPPVREVPDQQVFIARHSIGSRRLTAILAGGNNAERHNHNDLGHFIIALDERIVIPDMGAPQYTTDFFGPRRYTYLPASSRGHCCPIINGYEQRPGRAAAAKVIECVLDERSPFYRLDLTAAYPPEAGLQRWMRSLRTGNGAAVIEDEIDCKPASPTPVTHTIWTLDQPTVDGARLILDQMTITFDPPPNAIRVNPVTGKLLNLRQFRDQTLHHIEADYSVTEGSSLRTQTVIQVNAQD